MSRNLLLAKAIVVPGKGTLGSTFDAFYHAKADLYVFESTCLYDTITGTYFGGVRLMHNLIAKEVSLPKLDDSQLNYISVDISAKDRSHTRLSKNRKLCPLSDSQVSYLKNLFDVA